MSVFIDLEMDTTDAHLLHKNLRNEIIEIGAVRMDDAFHPLDVMKKLADLLQTSQPKPAVAV